MKKYNKTLLVSAIALGLMSTSGIANSYTSSDSAETHVNLAINPISYDTILGENGAFIDLDTDEFILNQQEWFQIQVYAEGALSLPITETGMKSALSIPDDIPFTDFQALLDQYVEVHDKAYFWKQDLYPDIVKLSLTLANYSDIQNNLIDPISNSLNVILSKAALQDEASKAEVENHRKMAIGYITALKNFSLQYQQQVADIETELRDFSAALETQQAQLNTLESTHSEYLTYDGSELQQRLKDLQDRIKQLNADYDHYTTVAATAVTYAWFPAVAIPIMGVYGDKAEKARKLRNSLTEEAADVESKLNYTQKIYNTYQRSTQSIQVISEKIDHAIPHINKLKLHWQKLNTDFESLLIALNAAEQDASILESSVFMGAAGAIANTTVAEKNWKDISEKAKAFANNAYIQEIK